MSKFQTRPVVVDADQFVLTEPGKPRYPVELAPCACDAMDGFTCGRHRLEPAYDYVIRDGVSNRWHWIRAGEWYVRFADGRVETYSETELRRRFEPASPTTEPQG